MDMLAVLEEGLLEGVSNAVWVGENQPRAGRGGRRGRRKREGSPLQDHAGVFFFRKGGFEAFGTKALDRGEDGAGGIEEEDVALRFLERRGRGEASITPVGSGRKGNLGNEEVVDGHGKVGGRRRGVGRGAEGA